MNATAEKRQDPQKVWIGKGHLLFEGRLGFLDWHQHSFLCLLVGIDGKFEVTWKHQTASCEILLVPSSWMHQLDFGELFALSFYIAPHQRLFSWLHQASQGKPLFASRSALWERVLRVWREDEDPRPLQEAIVSTWLGGYEGRALDSRMMRILQEFSQGRRLEHDNEALGAWVGLSASRLRHLCKEETGSSLRHLRRGYRFGLAARVMVEGGSFTEAAHAAGFADSSHFSRSFREAYGIPPTHLLPVPTKWELGDLL